MSNPSFGRWPEDDRPLPELPFLRKVGEDLWESYFTLVVGGIVLWVLCIPATVVAVLSLPLSVVVAAFTLLPGLAGLMVASGKAARGGFARLGDAARGAWRLYGRSVALTLPPTILLGLILITLETADRFPDRQEMLAAFAAQMGLELALIIMHIYLLPILALYDTPLKKTVRLAIALVGKFVWQTLALAAFGVALVALTSIHPLIWLLVPGLWSVVVMNATWRMTKLDERPTTYDEG